MQSKHMVIKCEHGLHVRVAGRIVKLVRQHDAEVRLHTTGGQADAGSIMEVLMLGAVEGASVEVVANGPDEALIVNALTEVFENGAGI